MNTFLGVVSVGFSRFGEEVTLSSDQITRSAAIIGEGGEEIGARVAIELHFGRKVLVPDIAGRVATGLSGYVQTFDSGYLMKDAFKVEEEGGHLHTQLVASALATIFNLPSAQESILNSIATSIAAEEGYASPGGMYDAANLVGGFRATDKEEVEVVDPEQVPQDPRIRPVPLRARPGYQTELVGVGHGHAAIPQRGEPVLDWVHEADGLHRDTLLSWKGEEELG